jgi:hypothetical protein
MKRRRTAYTSQLTGGTGDVNPQFMSGTLNMAVANTTVSQAIVLPISKGLFESRGKATIIEVLKIMIGLPAYEIVANVAETLRTRFVNISTQNHGAVAVFLNDANVIAAYSDSMVSAFTAGGTYAAVSKDYVEFDLTDGAGHGVLIASDYLYIQGGTAAYTAAGTYLYKILYRYKNVALSEYIGIVQSQQ